MAISHLAPGTPEARTRPTIVHSAEHVSPPNDEELYAYLGPQRRWVQWMMSLSFVLAASSLIRFSGNSFLLWPLYLVVALNLLGMVLSAVSGWNRRDLTAQTHYDFAAEWVMGVEAPPTVDVFLPTCGEEISVLHNTYRHVAAMRWWSNVTIWVLDDADRPEVARLAAECGFRYIVRPDRGRMKKAGNLQYAFGVTTSEFIVIFDADFCPRPDYLLHLMPYMQDEEVGIVQSPQHFATTTSMGWLERTAGATQELFYRWVQPSRDAVGGAICVGTCALYRRQALEAIGGFAQIEHSEDVHTGIFLLRAGYRTKFVPINVSRGLCPDSFSGFLNQQYRWCNGSITLLRSGQAQRRPLSLRQRLCFWAGFMYYITTAVNVFVIHLPGMIMMLFYPDQVRSAHFVPFLAGVWVYFALMPRVSTTRWRFEVLRVQMAYSFAHAVAITHKITGRTAGWVPTGSSGKTSTLARTISKVGAVTLTIILGVSWVAMIVDIHTYGFGNYWALALFIVGYTYLALPLLISFLRVLGIFPEERERVVARDALSPALNRISYYEVAAVTSLIVFGAAIARGYFDLFVPWS
jgi:cellulose synthase (UDP-forming)